MQSILILIFLLATTLWARTAPAQTADEPPRPCIACRANLATLRSLLSPSEWEGMMRGDIITSKSDGGGSDENKSGLVQSAMVVRQSPQEVWSVLGDFEKRPNYVPTAKKIEVVRRDGNEVWTDEHLSIILTTVYFRSINTLDPEAGSIRWRLDHTVKNDIADTTGSWEIAALQDEHTLILYRAHVESGRSVPKFLEDALSKRAVPKMMSGLRKELGRHFPELRDPDRPPDLKAQPAE